MRWGSRGGRPTGISFGHSPERISQRGGLSGWRHLFGRFIFLALLSRLDSGFGRRGTVPEPIRLVARFNDVAVMR